MPTKQIIDGGQLKDWYQHLIHMRVFSCVVVCGRVCVYVS